MMKLNYKINKGLRPDLLEKLFGVVETEEIIHSVSFCLTSPHSKQIVSSRESSKIFALFIQKLANGRTIRFLFPYDIKEVKKKIMPLNIGVKEAKGWLWLDITSAQFSILTQILVTVSFTTFYAQIDNDKALPIKPADLLNNLRQNYALIIFSLFDESAEILSMTVTEEDMISFAREICKELQIQSSPVGRVSGA